MEDIGLRRNCDMGGSRGSAWIWWALALAYPAFLLIASVRPEFGAEATRAFIEKILPHLDPSQVHVVVVAFRKACHFLGYGFFAIVLANAIHTLRKGVRHRKWAVASCIIAALIALGVAVLDEQIQSVVPHRTGASRDVALDFLGIVVGMLVKVGRGF
jgi:VanZ family protein